MSLLCNMSIFVLMVLPVVLLAKGHHMIPQRILPLIGVVASCLLLESTIIASLGGPGLLKLLQHSVCVLALPVMDTAVLNFVLNDPKARRALHVANGGDDAGAVVAVAWATADIVLFRWFRWYNVMQEPSFDQENLISAAEAFVNLVSLLLAARLIAVRADSKANNNNGNSRSVAVAGARVVAAAVAVFYQSHLLGGVAQLAILAALRGVLPH
uniref:Uncharacterized protein TCIL3000_7_4050 n=1 Tax=Trypanosoma congolense (strain IL3000) TaxID=1068625 RepID=G0UQD0_TRYCI|nr:unnamed protein product [Trypanosoma congolense IL3000]